MEIKVLRKARTGPISLEQLIAGNMERLASFPAGDRRRGVDCWTDVGIRRSLGAGPMSLGERLLARGPGADRRAGLRVRERAALVEGSWKSVVARQTE
jgi:hypothetical protein